MGDEDEADADFEEFEYIDSEEGCLLCEFEACDGEGCVDDAEV